MLILNVSEEKEKEVIELLEKNSIEYEMSYSSFGNFCYDEAEFRIFNLEILDEEIQDKVNNLTDEQKKELIDNVGTVYENEEILDTDYMDTLLKNEVEDFLNKNNEEE